jgi:hypothetical protein
MPLRLFYTHLCAQGMEGICELWHYLFPLLTHYGPSHVLVIIVFNRVILFLDGIHKKIPNGFSLKHSKLLCGIFLTVISPPNFDMGDILKERKGDIFHVEKNCGQRNNLLVDLTTFNIVTNLMRTMTSKREL